MFNLPFALKKAGNDTLSTVSSAATMVTASLNSAAALAETMEAHAVAYREDTKAALQGDAEDRRELAVQERAVKLAVRMAELDKQITDPKVQAYYEKLLAKRTKSRPISVAAE